MELKTDFDNIKNFDRVVLHPNNKNPLHKKQVVATFVDGYFYCDGSSPENGPDYYVGDVFKFNYGYTDV